MNKRLLKLTWREDLKTKEKLECCDMRHLCGNYLNCYYCVDYYHYNSLSGWGQLPGIQTTIKREEKA